MSRALLPTYRPLSGLEVLKSGEQSIHLASANGHCEVTVLAPDLFRICSNAGRKLRKEPSWAVCQEKWPPADTRIEVGGQQVRVRTTSAALTIDLSSAGWELRDVSGHPLFGSIAAETGFAPTGARLALGLAERESIFGLGETTGTFNKRGLIREFWNIDVLGHAPAIHPGLRALYISIPFAISLRRGRAAGLFWDNTSRQLWDVGQTQLERWTMKASCGQMDLYLFCGPEVRNVTGRYTELTGRMPLPPLWGLGYHQCRYSYETRQSVEEVASEFIKRRIPCDAVYLDIHHMNGYRVFTFGKAFPNPRRMVEGLNRHGIRTVAIVDPGVKDDASFGVLKRGVARKAFIKAPGSAKDFIGRAWPGNSRFPDFMNQRVRKWWGREQARLLEIGVAGIWNDMNEPAVFGEDTKTLPEECPHQTDFGPRKHSEVHNLYGMQMARASRKGALALQPNRRPFVITRAGYSGVQRYALAWTGDNSSVWEHMADAVQMQLNMGLSGLPFCGGDVGGFLDNTTPELLIRWTQMACLGPFFRNHSNIRTIRQEPWAFGTRTEQICRRYIQLRYRLMPYIYCLFAEAHRTGAPVMRPLLWHYASDATAVATGDQFLVGPDLMVAPVMRQGATARSVYLPAGAWYDFRSGERLNGARHVVALAPLDVLPIYVRAGALVPMASDDRTRGANKRATRNLHLWTGGNGALTWYEDDGETMEYERGSFSERRILLREQARGSMLRFEAARGDKAGAPGWNLTLHGLKKQPSLSANGGPLKGRYTATQRTFACRLPVGSEALTLRIAH